MLFSPASKVYLALGVTDMRKSIDRLCILVSEDLEHNPYSGNLFVFCNRRRTIIKILYWHINGFCVWQKRLEKHLFAWPQKEGNLTKVEYRELLFLLEGLDIFKVAAHKELSYKKAA